MFIITKFITTKQRSKCLFQNSCCSLFTKMNVKPLQQKFSNIIVQIIFTELGLILGGKWINSFICNLHISLFCFILFYFCFVLLRILDQRGLEFETFIWSIYQVSYCAKYWIPSSTDPTPPSTPGTYSKNCNLCSNWLSQSYMKYQDLTVPNWILSFLTRTESSHRYFRCVIVGL